MAHGGPPNTNTMAEARMDANEFPQNHNELYAGQYAETENVFVDWSSEWWGHRDESFADFLSTAFDGGNSFTGMQDYDMGGTANYDASQGVR
jgi:hypothetical protein